MNEDPNGDWPPRPSGNLPPLNPKYVEPAAPNQPSRVGQNTTAETRPPGGAADHEPLDRVAGDSPTSARRRQTDADAPAPERTTAHSAGQATDPYGPPTAPTYWQIPQPNRPPTRRPKSPPKPVGRGQVIAWSIGAALVGAVIAILVVLLIGLGSSTNTTGTVVVGETGTQNTVQNQEALETVIGIAEGVRPAIVNVAMTYAQGTGSGSGVIYNSDGLIMTNNHVVDGASQIQVELENGKKFDATLLGGDPDTDIAVLRIDETGLRSAVLGTATTLRIGEPAVAIGNPLGLEGGPTVTVGFISALGRTVRTSADEPPLVDMIQTDASIAEGSSGGALLNADGEVIGITTAIAVSQAGAGDIGFATPIDIAQNVADQIVRGGSVQHPFLGIRGTDFNDGSQRGALIISVEPGTPAAAAGLEPDDVVTAVDGKAVTSMSGLIVALRSNAVGDTVDLTVLSNGGTKNVAVTLAAKP